MDRNAIAKALDRALLDAIFGEAEDPATLYRHLGKKPVARDVEDRLRNWRPPPRPTPKPKPAPRPPAPWMCGRPVGPCPDNGAIMISPTLGVYA